MARVRFSVLNEDTYGIGGVVQCLGKALVESAHDFDLFPLAYSVAPGSC